MELIKLRVTAIKTETSDAKSFVLVPVNKRVQYLPGQFLTLVFPGKLNEERRSYSISSASFLGEPLTITVKRIDNGAFSRFLFDEVAVGATLLTIGASGFFLLPTPIEPSQKFFFLAAGSGITPMLPMTKSILHHTTNEVHLVFSNRSETSTIFRAVLLELAQTFHSRFIIAWLNSNSKNLLHARLSKLYLSDYVNRWAADKGNALFYVCGPQGYMQMVSITLLTEGVPSGNIRKEIFDTTKMVMKDLPPDVDAHNVTLTINGLQHHFTVQYPETVLMGAKREGIAVPFSCEAGKCGTCVATCLEGRVWMSYNEVLVERELQQGRVLTCTGYAVGGNVAIDYDQT